MVTARLRAESSLAAQAAPENRRRVTVTVTVLAAAPGGPAGNPGKNPPGTPASPVQC
jgi:hypothetical protein